MSTLPTTGFVRLSTIIGDKRRGSPGLIPVSRTSWWRGVAAGRYPKGVKIGPRSTGWPAEEIQALIDRSKAAVA